MGARLNEDHGQSRVGIEATMRGGPALCPDQTQKHPCRHRTRRWPYSPKRHPDVFATLV